MADTDGDVLQGSELTIELGGRQYRWIEPVRRQSRAMVKDLLRLTQKIAGKQDDPVTALEAVDDALEFFYKHHTQMRSDKQRLDNCTENEISEAFKQVSEWLLIPFVNTTTKGAAGLATTSTSSPESTST